MTKPQTSFTDGIIYLSTRESTDAGKQLQVAQIAGGGQRWPLCEPPQRVSILRALFWIPRIPVQMGSFWRTRKMRDVSPETPGELIRLWRPQDCITTCAGVYLEDHPRNCKWSGTPIYKPFGPCGVGSTLLRGPTNHGYKPLTSHGMILQVRSHCFPMVGMVIDRSDWGICQPVWRWNCWQEMGVSENRGTPQIIHFNEFSILNHPFWGYHYFWKHPNSRSFFEGFFTSSQSLN